MLKKSYYISIFNISLRSIIVGPTTMCHGAVTNNTHMKPGARTEAIFKHVSLQSYQLNQSLPLAEH